MTTTKPQSTKSPQETLLPCPFCPHGIGFVRNESGRYNGVVWVECDWPSHAVRLTAGSDAAPPCGARTAEYQTEEEAIKAWNTRAPASAAPVVDNNELISRRDAIEIANARLEDVPDSVDLEADRSLFAAGYLAAAGSIKAGLQRTAAATAAPVEQSDEVSNLLNEINKTARQLLRPSRTPIDIDFAVEYIVSRVTALRRTIAKTSPSSTSARAAAKEIADEYYFCNEDTRANWKGREQEVYDEIAAIIERHCSAPQLTEEESQLIIGAIPLRALPGEYQQARCANCAESILRTEKGWEHKYPYRPECLNAVPDEGAR